MERDFGKWRSYLVEGVLLGLFMVAACGFGVVLGHPGSPVVEWVESEVWRRGLMGMAMGVTAVVLIRSGWGQWTGAHMNPAVTLALWRLGRIGGGDAVGYVVGQFAGGVAGVMVMAVVTGGAAGHPAVNYVATVPGEWGWVGAMVGEVVISFLLMTVVLWAGEDARWGRYTAEMAGLCVGLFILVEAPVSGMSMNPARSLGSAAVAMTWGTLWIYFVGPVAGMLGAAEVYVWGHEGGRRWAR